MNWNYFIVGAIVAAGGAAIAIYRQTKKCTMSFADYCNNCEKAAESEIGNSDDVVRTILVLANLDETRVAPFIYRSYKDGKIRKKRIDYKTYLFCLCPEDVQESINKGEYIIKRY